MKGSQSQGQGNLFFASPDRTGIRYSDIFIFPRGILLFGIDLLKWLLILTITEQKGRAFNGVISYQKRSDDKPYGHEGFSGVIGPDMKTLYLGEYNSGLSIGHLLDPDTLELIFLNNGKNGSAGIDTFTREKT